MNFITRVLRKIKRYFTDQKQEPETIFKPLPKVNVEPIQSQDYFLELLESEFGVLKSTQYEGIQRLLTECDNQSVDYIEHKANVLAQVWHETGKTMQPIKEWGGNIYLRSKKYYPYYGRGYIQLTHKYNYEKFEKLLNIPLVKEPDLALDPIYSAFITVYGMKNGTFTGKKLSDYFSVSLNDSLNARRIVNGLDKADLISTYHYKFLNVLNKNSYKRGLA